MNRLARALAALLLLAPPAALAGYVFIPEDDPVLVLEVPETWEVAPGDTTILRPEKEGRKFSMTVSRLDGPFEDGAAAVAKFHEGLKALGSFQKLEVSKASLAKTGAFASWLATAVAADRDGNPIKTEARVLDLGQGEYYVIFLGGEPEAFDALANAARAIMETAAQPLEDDSPE